MPTAIRRCARERANPDPWQPRARSIHSLAAPSIIGYASIADDPLISTVMRSREIHQVQATPVLAAWPSVSQAERARKYGFVCALSARRGLINENPAEAGGV
ncbi:MAG: hypothetical protein ABI790_03110 [Betaproteobacteria bacterium]